MKLLAKHKCSPSCWYFPSSFGENDLTIDKNGVKHCTTSAVCHFDNHVIKHWLPCENYCKQAAKPMPSVSWKSKVIIITGKSAAGKDTLANLAKSSFGFNSVISHTTRPIREGEKQGVNYYYIDEDTFHAMETKGDFIETRQYNTLFDGEQAIWYYGTSKKAFEETVQKICIVDTTGYEAIKNYYGAENLVTIYIDAADNIRKERAKLRGTFSEEEWNRRLEDDNKKFNVFVKSTPSLYVIDNNNTLENSFASFAEVLAKELLI